MAELTSRKHPRTRADTASSALGASRCFVSMALTTAGALALALLYAALPRRLPADGGGRPFDQLVYATVDNCRYDMCRSLLVMGADVRLAGSPDAALVATLGS